MNGGNLITGHGQRTREIAEKLQENLHADRKRYSEVQLFYDHGDSSKAEVCQPTSYMGRCYGSNATLSGLDIILVHKGKVFLLVEVEESEVRPKTILGDVFGVVVADRVSIRGRSLPISNATMIVAVTVSGHGRRAEKYVRLERRLGRHLEALRRTTSRSKVAKIRIVTSDADDLARRIERLIRLEVGRGVDAR